MQRTPLMMVVFLLSVPSLGYSQGGCPRLVPSSIHLYLPVALPPGPHPFVLDRTSVWVFCDTAPVGGVPFDFKVTGSALVRAEVFSGDTARAESDATYLWPNLQISAMSTAIAPRPRTVEATVEIHAGGGVATLRVIVTITGAPFLRTSETTLGFRMPGDSPWQSLPFWFPNATKALSATAAVDSSWLSVSPSSGTGYTELKVAIDPANLSPGSYFGSIVFTSEAAINSPMKIPVRMIVDQAPSQHVAVLTIR